MFIHRNMVGELVEEVEFETFAELITYKLLEQETCNFTDVKRLTDVMEKFNVPKEEQK